MFNSTGHLKTQMELMEEYKARDKPKTKKKPKSEVACAAIEVKSMCKPPVAVKETMSAVTSLMGYPRAQAERWATAKKALADMTFAAQLESVVPSCVPKENVAYAKEKLADTGSPVDQRNKTFSEYTGYNEEQRLKTDNQTLIYLFSKDLCLFN